VLAAAGEAALVTEEVFDAVVVAVGQFVHPRLPTIKGKRLLSNSII
jgi:cation diffusion facilitator CzcD-associated flavoprotein CzcO